MEIGGRPSKLSVRTGLHFPVAVSDERVEHQWKNPFPDYFMRRYEILPNPPAAISQQN